MPSTNGSFAGPEAGHPLRPCLHRRASKERLLPRPAIRSTRETMLHAKGTRF